MSKKLIVLVILFLSIISCDLKKNETKREKYEYLKEKVEKEIRNKNYKKAEEYYLEAIKYDKEAYFDLGILYYYDLNDVEKAEQKLKEAYEKGVLKSASLLGIIYEEKGNLDLAKEWYLRGIKNNDKFSLTLYGVLLVSENKTEEAKKYLKIENMNHALELYSLMRVYYKERDKEKIFELKGKMLKTERLRGLTEDIMIKINLMLGDEKKNKIFDLITEAETLLKKRKMEEAKEEYEKTFKYGYEGAYFLGQFYFSKTDYKNAEKYFLLAYDKAKIYESLYYLGKLKEMKNKKSEAEIIFKFGETVGNMNCIQALAKLKYNNGEESEAENLFLKGYEFGNAEAVLSLMNYYENKGNFNQSKEVAESLIGSTNRAFFNYTSDIEEIALETINTY